MNFVGSFSIDRDSIQLLVYKIWSQFYISKKVVQALRKPANLPYPRLPAPIGPNFKEHAPPFLITNVYSLSSRINKVTTVPEAFSWGFCTGCLVAAKQPRKDSKNCCGKTESALVVEAHFCRTSVTRV